MGSGTNNGPERRIRAPRDGMGPRETNKGPEDESGLLKTNQVLRPVWPTRTQQDKLGHREMRQGLAGWVRALGDEPGLRRKNRVPYDESGPRRTDQGAARDGSGPLGRTRDPRGGSTPQGMDQGPTGRIRAPEEESGPRGSGKDPALTDQGPERRIGAPQDVSGPRGTDQSPERRIRAPLYEPGPLRTKQALRDGSGFAGPRSSNSAARPMPASSKALSSRPLALQVIINQCSLVSHRTLTSFMQLFMCHSYPY